MKILKYSPLFPIYYLINPDEVGDIVGSLGANLLAVILIVGIAGGGQGKDTKGYMEDNQTYTLEEYTEKIDTGLSEGLDKLKESYYERLKVEEEDREKKTYNNAYSRLTSKPTDRDQAMAEDYLSAIQQASERTGVPQWVIMGLSVLEGGPMYTTNPPVPGSSIPTHLYGVDGMNFKTYGYGQVLEGLGDRSSGETDGAGVAGPFKFKQASWDSWGEDGNGDGIVDRYNLYDASIGAANMLKGNKSNLDGISETITDDAKWIWSAGAFNAGLGGMLARVPWDSVEDFLSNDLEALVNDIGTQASVYAKYMNGGRGWHMRKPILEFWDGQGWRMDNELRTKALDRIPNLDITQPVGTSNPNGSWPGTIEGHRSDNGYTTSRSEVEVMERLTSDGKRIAMNMESLEYLVAVVSIGKTLEKELEYKVLGGEETSSYPDGFKARSMTGVDYYWEQDNSLLTKPKVEKLKVEGALGEVGWKGKYPLFVQKPNANSTSNLPWKFKGRGTTLGKSGCSLYSLASVIHGAGLGEYNIPGTNMKPTLENLSKVFTNGPIIYPEVSIQGYKTISRPTRTDEDLSKLFEEIKAGVPYIINTRYGEVRAINSDGEEVITKFTSGGHFIVAVSGFEKDGRRYIEVVQSSRSEAGTIPNDQNTLSFDYDHLVENKIIQSSGGHSVPAYTVVGIKDGGDSTFLSDKYKPPSTGNIEGRWGYEDVVSTRRSITEEKVSSRNLDMVEDLVDSDDRLKVGERIILRDTSLVTYEGNDMLIYLDYVNAILIENLDSELLYEGVVQEGTDLGVTTTNTTYKYMVRNEYGEWEHISNTIEVTED